MSAPTAPMNHLIKRSGSRAALCRDAGHAQGSVCVDNPTAGKDISGAGIADYVTFLEPLCLRSSGAGGTCTNVRRIMRTPGLNPVRLSVSSGRGLALCAEYFPVQTTINEGDHQDQLVTPWVARSVRQHRGW
jgi:hypothetical protein